jgi:IclR family pca regulon transcriptional regulator
MADTPTRNYNITALRRGLRLLRLFSELPQGLTAKRVACRSRLPESTVHRFLANLESAGFAKCNGDGVYRMGMACFAIGQAAFRERKSFATRASSPV